MPLLLQTALVAPDDRVDHWRSAMRTALKAECRIEPKCAQAFDVSLGVMPLGELKVIEFAGDPYKSTRLGAGEEGWVSVMFQLDGVSTVSLVNDGRRAARLAPGDACVIPADREFVLERSSRFRQAAVNLPVGHLAEVCPHWQQLTAVTIDGERPASRPLTDLLGFVLDHHPSLDAGCLGQLAATTTRLLGQLLGTSLAADAAAPVSPARAGVAQMHRTRIERWILDNLRDPELSVKKMAGEVGLSVRYVHKLFERQPANVMQWALSKRLQACQRDIASRGARSISDVAYSWGFNSPSHFSRVFKRRFGVRPSDL